MLSGPYSTSSSSGWPVFVSAAALASAATNSSWMDSCDEHAGGGRAVLAGVEVARDGDVLDGLGDVGVLEDDDRRLAAQLQVDALDVLGRGLGDLHAGPYGAGDGGHRRGRVLDHRAAGVAVAADDVEDALGQDLRR